MFKLLFIHLFRRPRHTISIAFGVIISVSLIAGIFIASSNIGAIVLQKHLEIVPFDFLGVQDSMHNYDFAIKDFEDAEYVEKVETFTHLIILGEINKTPQEPLKVKREWISIAGADKSLFESVSELIVVNGTFDLAHSYSAGVTSAFAEKYNLTLGDEFYLTSDWARYVMENHTIEFVVTTAKFRLNFIFEINETIKEYASHIGLPAEFVLVNSSYAYSIYNDFLNKPLHLIPGAARTFYFIFIDRESIVNPFDMPGTLQRLQVVNETLYYKGLTYFIQVYDLLTPVIEDLIAWTNFNMFTFSVFSLPLVVISILTTVSATNIMMDERRREIGLLKIRGASSSQVSRILLAESIVIGLFASMVSYFVSWIIGYLLTYVMNAYWKITAVNIPLIPELSMNYLMLLFGLGIGITVASTYTPIMNISKLSLREFVAEYVSASRIEQWRPKWTLLGLALGSYKIMSWILGIELADLQIPTGGFLQTLVWYNLIFLDAYILRYIGPLIFIYSLSKIITMRLDVFSRPLRFSLRPLFKKLDMLIMSSISKKTSRYVRVSFIIALTISFGITASIMSTSEYDYHMTVAKMELGADINIEVYPGSYRIMDQISMINGVRAVTFIGRFRAWFIFRRVVVYAIDPEVYYNVTSDFMDPSFVVLPEYSKAIKALATPNERKYILNAMINREFAEQFDKEIGTFFVLFSMYGLINGSVVGIYDLFAGLKGYVREAREVPTVLLSFEYLKPLGITLAHFDDVFILVDVEDNASIKEVKNEINDRFSSKIISIDTIEERIEEILTNPLVSSTYNFLRLEFIFTGLIATIGVAYVTIVSILERKREFGILFVRGMDRQDLIKLILGEFLVILAIAYILGTITGYATGIGYAYFFGKYSESIIPYRVIITYEPVYILVGSFIAFVITVLVPAYILSKTNVRESLRAT